VASWVPYIFRDFYFVKNHKTANNSTKAEEAEEKLSTESLGRESTINRTLDGSIYPG